MQGITTEHNTLGEIQNRGFSILPVSELKLTAQSNSVKTELMKEWDDLIIDEHMNDGGKYRYRRYGRFELNGTTMELTDQDDTTYFQTKEYNALNGGVNRDFAPLSSTTKNNRFLKDLIIFDYQQVIGSSLGQNWNVGIHQIRITAEPGVIGQPAPEGIHKDGEMFTVQHLIERKNVNGGMNAIYDNDKNLIHKWTQQDIFDSYYFKDDAVYHSVSEISSADQKNAGYRDILLIDFDPINKK